MSLRAGGRSLGPAAETPAGLEWWLNGDGDLVIKAPRKGRKPETTVYGLTRCAGGFVLTKAETSERHFVAGGECTCEAFRRNGGCKHRTALLALYREGKVK